MRSYRISTYVKLFAVVSIKVFFLVAFLPSWSFEVFAKSVVNFLTPTSRIYEKTVEEYVQKNVFYIELAEWQDGEAFFADLQRQWLVDEYSQPFTSLDIPYYRVKFSVRDDVAKRTIALLLNNGSVSWLEWVPRFEIQQTFTHGTVAPRQWADLDMPPSVSTTSRRQLTGKPIRFSTQQVREESFEWQWYLDEIGFEKENLICLTTERPKTKVAIIDNAFMPQHPSFADSVVFSRDIADGDDDVTPLFKDEEWMHGTHSAWLIAGKKFSNQWIIGTSLGSAELYLLKATTDGAEPTEITHGIEAFAKAVQMNVDIISLSRWAYMDFPVFHKIVQKALDKWIVVISAAGNYWSDDFFYPAAYEDVIAVWSFDKAIHRSAFSNFWWWVDIYAPGEQLVVPDSEQWFAKTDGTSAAAPLFAGIYSLLVRSFGKGGALEALYAKQWDEFAYVDISDVCRETTDKEFPVIQQIETQTGDDESIVDKEHTAAPEVVVQELPLPSFWQRILVLAREWLWVMISSFLFVILLVTRLFKKTLPKSESEQST